MAATITMYESVRGGAVRSTLSGVSVSPAPGEAGGWLIRTGPGFAPPGFAPRAGDRFRDDGGRWWAVLSAGPPDAAGVVTLTCQEEAP